MKSKKQLKNNSFRHTFYLGLLIIFLIGSLLLLIGVNVYNSITPKFKKDKLEIYIETVEPKKDTIHDTIYIDKPVVKSNNTPKSIVKTKPKETSIVVDSTVIIDTVK